MVCGGHFYTSLYTLYLTLILEQEEGRERGKQPAAPPIRALFG